MWIDNKTYRLTYLAWSCILHISAFLLIILTPRANDLNSETVEITFQVAGEGVNLGSKKGDSLNSLKAKSAPTKNTSNDSLLSKLEAKISKGVSKYKVPKMAAAKASNTQARSKKSSSLKQELNHIESKVAKATSAAIPVAVTKNNTATAEDSLDDSSLDEDLNTNNDNPVTNNAANAEESGLRNLVKKSSVSVPRQQVLGKRSFKSSRTSALAQNRNSSNRKSAFGKRTSKSNRTSALAQNRNSSKRKSAFGKRTSKSNRTSALAQNRNSSNRKSAFGKRDSKAKAASMFSRNSKSKRPVLSGGLGSRNQSGARVGSAFDRSNKGNANKTRTASALGNTKGRSKRSYGNAFGRGGAGSGKTFGLPKGIRDARSLKQIDGNPVPSYPYPARVRKNQGVVYLVYYVDNFGKVSRVKIHRSSGFSILDNSAQKTIARYRYYKGQSGYVIHPIEFTLKGTVKVETNGKSKI